MIDDSGSNRRDGPGEPWGVRGIRVADRMQYLVAHCRGKSVLHVGCTSAGLTERKLRGDLPHAALARVASALSGVDIDVRGLEILKSAGYEVFCCDAGKIAECLAGRQFEVVVMGNMLDFLPDPGAAIQAARDLLHPTGKLIVTIANAVSLKHVLWWVTGRDPAHPQAVFVSTPSTIAHLVEQCNLVVREIRAFWFGPDCFAKMTLGRRVFYAVAPRVPRLARWADGWIVVASHISSHAAARRNIKSATTKSVTRCLR